MSTMRGFDAAQREWENRTPPDDGPYECPDCYGKGERYSRGIHPLGEEIIVPCPCCGGFGQIDENGEPHDPHAKERAECEYADMKRDDRLTIFRGGRDPEADE